MMKIYYTRLLLLFAAILTCGTTIAQTYSGGSGTANDPYLISTPADLLELSANANGDWFGGKFYRMTNNIDMSGVTDFKPIGSQNPVYDTTLPSEIFVGTFDGSGYVIKNLTVMPHALQVRNNGFGMFGTANATIKNLGLINPVADGNAQLGSDALTQNRVGAICGSFAGTIENCFVTGATVTGNGWVGAVVGVSFNAGVTIKNVYCHATTITAGWGIAGIVGELKNTATIENLFFYGDAGSLEPILKYNETDVAEADRTFSNCYYKAGSTSKAFGDLSYATAEIAEADLGNLSAFAGFTTDVWATYGGMPILKAFSAWSSDAEDDKWENANNWLYGTVPTAQDFVCIRPASNFQPKITASAGTAQAASISIPLTGNKSGKLTVDATGVLKVDGTITSDWYSGLLIIYGATNKAQLTFSGMAKALVNHNIAAGGAQGAETAKWQAFSTGVSADLSSTPDPTTGEAISIFNGSATNKVFICSFDESVATPASDATTYPVVSVGAALMSGKGYLVYSNEGHTLQAKGMISNAEQTFASLGMTGSGFHLLGNKMTADVDVSQITLPVSTFEQAVWVFNSSNQSFEEATVIKPGQSFMVKVGSGSGDVVLPLAAQNMDAAKKSETTSPQLIVSVVDGEDTDQVKIRINDEAVAEKDNYDLSKLFSFKENKVAIYSTIANNNVSTNSVPSHFEGRIPVKVRIGESGQAMVSLQQENALDGTQLRLVLDGEVRDFDGEFTQTFNGETGEEITFYVEFSKKALSSTSLASKLSVRNIANDLIVNLAGAKTAQLAVYSLQGALLSQSLLTADNNRSSLDLQTGVYLVKVQANNETLTQKIFIK